ncbi:hypothetical protein PCC6912_48640 [Chlorogloeopsis fritschii PCC 6912]|uniref:Uncharacterized protein n=1 Tax=Chlorogloeopsis fritschii PCC 6912 TaxID=211165 RepID=A0A433N2H7_CHLFR|nr:hypothetical protein PCC6912_48640 [Chlorogloeopsis fritschii PCC 6912]
MELFITDANNNPSLFTKLCIIAPFQKIYNIIQNDFSRNELVQSTTIKIKNSNRKYPLHKLGERIELKFIIENEGPGYAFDVVVELLDIDKGLIPVQPDPFDPTYILCNRTYVYCWVRAMSKDRFCTYT